MPLQGATMTTTWREGLNHLGGVDHVRVLQPHGEGKGKFLGKAGQRGQRPAGEDDGADLAGTKTGKMGGGGKG